MGVLRGLEELGLKPDVLVGCSVGAVVGGAYLAGAMDAVETWARELSPLSAMQQFTLKVHRGGFIDASTAFDAFRDFDKNIEDLPTTFAAVAVDLSTGEEVTLTEGSLIEAIRASSAIPLAFHAINVHGRWLADGALANPAPVSTARALGADIVISVDLNAAPRVLDRFEPKPATLPTLVEPGEPQAPGFSGAVAKLIDDTRASIKRQFEYSRARANAAPQLLETAMATIDIFQMHLSRARAHAHPADILLEPDMRGALPNAFDRADEFIEEGRAALMAKRDEIETLLEKETT